MKNATKLASRTCEIEVDSIIVPDGYNARQQFDEQLLIELGKSMEQNTQLAPIIVNRFDGKNYLVAGERRLRAAQECGQAFIEAKVFENLDQLTSLRMHLAENSHRVGLNVIEQARAYNRLVEHGMTVEQIAKEEGVGAITIERILKLLTLAEEVQRLMVRDNHPLPLHQALCLLSLPESEQISLARRAAPVGGPVAGEKQVKEWAEDTVGKPLPFDRSGKKGRDAGTDDDGFDDQQDIRPQAAGKDESKEEEKKEKVRTVKVSAEIIGNLVIPDGYNTPLRLNGAKVVINPGGGRSMEFYASSIGIWPDSTGIMEAENLIKKLRKKEKDKSAARTKRRGGNNISARKLKR